LPSLRWLLSLPLMVSSFVPAASCSPEYEHQRTRRRDG
jgi:hypothetical protein